MGVLSFSNSHDITVPIGQYASKSQVRKIVFQWYSLLLHQMAISTLISHSREYFHWSLDRGLADAKLAPNPRHLWPKLWPKLCAKLLLLN